MYRQFFIMIMTISILQLLALVNTTKVFAQQQGNIVMRDITPISHLIVELEPIWYENGRTSFKLSFLTSYNGIESVQQHVDYAFVILRGQDGAQVFDAAQLIRDKQVQQRQNSTGELLHTIEGIVIVPYTFENSGDYVISVTLTGVNFVPTPPQTVTFPIKVVPEFPESHLVAACATCALIAVTIIHRSRLVSRLMNPRKRHDKYFF